MKQANDILNELRELNSPLADMSRHMLYQVPEGYFEELASTVMMNVQDAGPVSQNFSKEMPFFIPTGYFENLAENIVANISVNNLPKNNPQLVPEGYFNELPAQILNRVKELPAKKKTRVVVLNSISIWQQIRLGAAAILVIGIGLGMYKYNVDKRSFNLDKALSDVPEYAINDYLNQHVDDVDAEMILGTAEADTHASIKQLNEEEIRQYLNETGNEKERNSKTEN